MARRVPDGPSRESLLPVGPAEGQGVLQVRLLLLQPPAALLLQLEALHRRPRQLPVLGAEGVVLDPQGGGGTLLRERVRYVERVLVTVVPEGVLGEVQSSARELERGSTEFKAEKHRRKETEGEAPWLLVARTDTSERD